MPKPLPSHTLRLSKLVNRPGGLTAEEAVQAAEARLETIKDASLLEIASLIDKMQALGEELIQTSSRDTCDALYKTSNVVVGAAGVFALPEVGEVAFSLCDLLDCQRASGVWNPLALRLHLDSLKLIFSNKQDVSKRTVIDGLHQMVQRISGNRR